MTLIGNLMLFIFFFLPVTLVMGLACDFFVGPLETTRWGYEVQLYYIHVFKLLVPSIIAVPPLHSFFRSRAKAMPENALRVLAVITTPLALLAVHLVIFRSAYWSAPLTMLFVFPGALYGYLFRIPGLAGKEGAGRERVRPA